MAMIPPSGILKPLTFLIIFAITRSILANAQSASQPTAIVLICNSTANGTYEDNSSFGVNLYSLLSDLESRSSTAMYYSSFAGNDSNGYSSSNAYGLYYCRHDLSVDTCNNCVATAVQTALPGGSCYGVTSVAMFYQECTLRFSNHSLAGILEYRPRWYDYDEMTRPPSQNFSQVLDSAVDRLTNRVVFGDDSNGFAAGTDNITEHVTLYSMVQCRDDIKGSLCLNCLQATYKYMGVCCTYQATRMLAFAPCCQLRFGITPFENSTAPTPSHPPPGTSYYITRIVVPVVVGLLLFAVVGCWFWLQKRKAATANTVHTTEGTIECFNLREIQNATTNFSEANKLGHGGFGSVYKGILPNGQVVAMKRLSGNSFHRIKEFKTEVDVVARLQHRNLVKLVGYCAEKEERILVYEFLSNLSLDKFLFDATKSINLDWRARYRVIEGIALGLRYLHIDSSLNFVHRDLKCGSILLDKEMNPKIADFGLAKLVSIDETTINTSTIAGTRGYMAPEYALAGSFSTKSDIYSFGVIILEIISGKSINCLYDPVSGGGLPHYAWRLWKEKAIEELIDPALHENHSMKEVERCTQIGLLCIQYDTDRRPSIRAIVNFLENQAIELPLPSAPSIFLSGTGPTTSTTFQTKQTRSSQTESGASSNGGSRP